MNKACKYKIKHLFGLKDFYQIWEKGMFRWKYITEYDTFEKAQRWIISKTEDAVYYDENGKIIR